MLLLLAVLGVDRLARDAEGLADLLPRPARLSSGGNVRRFNPLGQAV
jgi:hypothetical protein